MLGAFWGSRQSIVKDGFEGDESQFNVGILFREVPSNTCISTLGVNSSLDFAGVRSLLLEGKRVGGVSTPVVQVFRHSAAHKRLCTPQSAGPVYNWIMSTKKVRVGRSVDINLSLPISTKYNPC